MLFIELLHERRAGQYLMACCRFSYIKTIFPTELKMYSRNIRESAATQRIQEYWQP